MKVYIECLYLEENIQFNLGENDEVVSIENDPVSTKFWIYILRRVIK